MIAELPAVEPVERRPLTPHQLRIMRLVATGAPAKTLAPELGMSYHTFKNNLTAIYGKLEVTNAIEAFGVLGWLRVSA